jgi:hypothetical protein
LVAISYDESSPPSGGDKYTLTGGCGQAVFFYKIEREVRVLDLKREGMNYLANLVSCRAIQRRFQDEKDK